MSNNGTIEKHKLVEIAVEQSAESLSNATPLPGALAKAFPLPELKVGAFSVRAPRAYDWTLLKAINSPIHRQILEMANALSDKKDVDFTDEEGWDICYQFTRSCREVDAVYCAGGHAALRAKAKEIFAFELETVQIAEIVKAVILQIANTWETAMSYKGDEKGEGATTFFRDTETQRQTG